jgi:arginyl-tRNA synthetase
MRTKLTRQVVAALESLKGSGTITVDIPRVQLVPPKHAAHGDFATAAALALAKPLKKNPREIAGMLQKALGNAGGLLDKTEIAGPGYLNMFVARSAWHRLLSEILAAGESFVRSDHGGGRRILVEFVSANPTGPLHIAHGRGAVTGDVIAGLLDAAGYDVEREYYINDLGHQTDVYARSLHLRYCELFGRTVATPEDFYPGEYVTELAALLKEELGDRYLDAEESEWIDVFRNRGIELMRERIRADLDAFGIRFDNWVSERELTARVGLDDLVARLERSGHVFEADGKKWFCSTDFGDDKDRVVVRDDGRPTYFASDIAYHDEKMSRGFEKLINVWGADHAGYIARVQAGMQALGYAKDALEIILIQMVSLSRGGQSVKIGKRLGTAVWLRDVIAEAGKDATRYFFVMRRSDAQLDFDIELATKKSLDNPVYYAQMGHARMCSIARRAKEAGVPDPGDGEGALDALVLPEELGMIKTMGQAPDVIADAADAHEPHQVVYFIQDLIGQFHSYFTQYKNTEKVVSDDAAKTRARLLMCQALRTTLRALLGVLGVDAPDRMVLEEEAEA